MSVTERFFTVQTPVGYRESVDYTDLRTGRAKVLEVISEPVAVDPAAPPLLGFPKETEVEEVDAKSDVIQNPDVSIMTDDEIRAWVADSGLKGLLSPDMIRKHPPELMAQLVVQEGKTARDIRRERNIASTTISTMKVLYGLSGVKAAGRRKAEPENDGEAKTTMTDQQITACGIQSNPESVAKPAAEPIVLQALCPKVCKDQVIGKLQTVMAIQTLEYHDKNYLAQDDKRRSEEKMRLLQDAIHMLGAIPA